MRYLAWDESLFRDPDVFDPDHLPEEYLYRDIQLTRLQMNLKPAIKKSRPINSLCLGPPGTGKTTAVKLLFKEIEEFENVITVYVNCQIINSKQQVFAKIFEKVYGYSLPSYGTPFSKVYYSIMNRIKERDNVLIVALDDLNFLLDDFIINETLYALLKAHEEVEGVKTGIIGIATDLKLTARLDERTGSIFHPDEIFFPPYGREEIRDILASRAKIGFYPNVLSEEALDMITDLTFEGADLRLGLYLLKMSGLETEKRASTKIEVRDVEKVSQSGKKVFLRKLISALSEEEKVLLELIYSNEDMTSGELYNIMKEKVKAGYTKFYEMLNKLESIKLIDTRFDKRKRGRTRSVIRRYDPEVLLNALKEF
ncbi:MAG TPA: ORC1-type DNA replication protein [Archaeoglobaceae archaeon]|nr:ORC1-type DNA replication protein [Archaeoglobaceae archaeon]